MSDIEGAELGVVRFDVEALRRCRLAIIEFHDVDDLNWNIVKLETEWMKCGFKLVDKYGPVCVMERSNDA
ncbi:MAG: hypothetical protein ACKVHE_29185 [Planctomycetales bacterium]